MYHIDIDYAASLLSFTREESARVTARHPQNLRAKPRRPD